MYLKQMQWDTNSKFKLYNKEQNPNTEETLSMHEDTKNALYHMYTEYPNFYWRMYPFVTEYEMVQICQEK